MTDEFQFIRSMERSILQTQSADISVGIGDDCAVWNVGGQHVLLATDMLIQNVHFDLQQMSFDEVGRKCIAVNLSDIAAMGGRPKTAMVSLALPESISHRDVQSLMDGIIQLGQQYQTYVVGGDTTSHSGDLIVNVAITGIVEGIPVLRSGAHSGDVLFVTGPLGGSIYGHHWSFTPRIQEALCLKGICQPTAMIDLSDGLASDIRHIAQQSGVGCLLDESSLPISEAVPEDLTDNERLKHALSDGEDFELLLTVSPEDADLVRKQKNVKVYEIGEMQGHRDSIMMKRKDETLEPIPDSGWKHHFD